MPSLWTRPAAAWSTCTPIARSSAAIASSRPTDCRWRTCCSAAVEKHCGVRIPDAEAELVLFVLRIALKHLSPIELLKVHRHYGEVVDELAWLRSVTPVRAASGRSWQPTCRMVGQPLFDRLIEAIARPGAVTRRIVLAGQLAWRLRHFRRLGWAADLCLAALAADSLRQGQARPPRPDVTAGRRCGDRPGRPQGGRQVDGRQGAGPATRQTSRSAPHSRRQAASDTDLVSAAAVRAARPPRPAARAARRVRAARAPARAALFDVLCPAHDPAWPSTAGVCSPRSGDMPPVAGW